MGDTADHKDYVGFGILKCLGVFEHREGKGYRVRASCRNPEPVKFLGDIWGGSVYYGKYSSWHLEKEEEVKKLWHAYKKWANENQKNWVPEKWKERERIILGRIYGQTE